MICETAYVNITSDSFKTLSLEKNAFLIKKTSKLDKHKNTKDEYHFNFMYWFSFTDQHSIEPNSKSPASLCNYSKLAQPHLVGFLGHLRNLD